MTGMVRKALTIAAGFAVVASVASAGVPDPAFSTVDAVVVGDNSGIAIGAAPAGFDVTVRDINNALLTGRTVTLDFTSSGMKGYTTQNAGTTVNVAGKSLSRVTDGVGTTKFAARIAKYNNSNTIVVTASGVVLSTVKGRATDLDGVGGSTGLNDLVLFSNNFLNIPSAQETDYDQSGLTGLNDLVIFSAEFLNGPTLVYAW